MPTQSRGHGTRTSNGAHMNIVVETPIAETPRVAQIRGMFDLPAEKSSRLSWKADLPLGARPWSIGLIVGPSGCGKTTIARRVFPELHTGVGPDLAERLAIGSAVDAFPET